VLPGGQTQQQQHDALLQQQQQQEFQRQQFQQPPVLTIAIAGKWSVCESSEEGVPLSKSMSFLSRACLRFFLSLPESLDQVAHSCARAHIHSGLFFSRELFASVSLTCSLPFAMPLPFAFSVLLLSVSLSFSQATAF